MTVPAIRTENLCHAYGEAVTLQGVTLDIQPGEAVGLVGPNGAGKSTLFLVVGGILAPTGGRVEVCGLPVEKNGDLARVRRRIGIVFQHSDDQLFQTTVRDDIAFGPLNLGLERERVLERTREMVRLVGLDESYLPRIPYRLSAGEKRRVAIAGVLAMEPEVLLLDEPTSDLDPQGKRRLAALLGRLGMTRVVSSHDLEFVRATCPRVVVLYEGRVAAEGPTDEVFGDEELMEAHGLEVPHSLRQGR